MAHEEATAVARRWGARFYNRARLYEPGGGGPIDRVPEADRMSLLRIFPGLTEDELEEACREFLAGYNAERTLRIKLQCGVNAHEPH